MRIFNKYIISLVLASCFINALLAFYEQNDLVVYFAINVLAYLAITLLYASLNPRARRVLNTIGIVFFGGFMVTVAIKVVEILSSR